MGFTAAAEVIAPLVLDAGTVAAADATAAGLGFSSAAEAISAGAVDAATLGLPEAATVADLGAVDGTASAGFVSSGAAPGVAGGVPAGTDLASQAAPYAGDAQYAAQDVMQQARDVGAAAGTPTAITTGAAPSSLSDILGTAKTGAQLVGGLGQLAQGAQLLGGAGRVSPQQADPFAQYRSGLAGQLNQLLTSPQTVTTTPGYQFNLAQGLQAQQAQQAAQGRLVSGGALLQSQQFGQQLAGQSYQQQLQNLATLSGAYQTPATGAGAVQSTALGNVGQTALGLQAVGGGAANVLNPLATLYSQYNTPSPSVT